MATQGLVGKILGGRYRLEQRVGQGAIGDVYRATDTQSDQVVAVKVVHSYYASKPSFQARFIQTFGVIATLQHSNIMPVRDYEARDGYLYVVMDYVDGGALTTLIEQKTRGVNQVDLLEAVEIVSQLARALHFAHQQNILHRDLTPKNVLLRNEGSRMTPLLMDFELVSIAESGTDTALEDTLGTPRYMSPEQASGISRYDRRSDVYSLGVVLYELLTGQTPYQAETLQQIVQAQRGALPSIRQQRPDIIPELENIVQTSLANNPPDRYQTAYEMARALDMVRDLLKQPSAPPPPAVSEFQEALLTITEEERVVQEVALNRESVTLGRGDDQDIVIFGGKRVSRRHLRIARSPESYTVEDLGSSNGTKLDGRDIPAHQPQAWAIGQTVEIGPYHLDLKPLPQQAPPIASDPFKTRLGEEAPAAPPPVAPRSTAPPPRPNPLTDTRPPQQSASLSGPATSDSVPAYQAPPEQAPVSDLVGVTQEPPPFVDVQPGQPVPITVELQNRSQRVENFEIQVTGVPEHWYNVANQTLNLMPQAKGVAIITFNPPMDSSAKAGSHQVGVGAQARVLGTHLPLSNITITVTPFYNFSTALNPESVRRRGRTTLTIENHGNSTDTYEITGKDRSNDLIIKPDEDRVTVEPGEQAEVPIHIKPRQVDFVGSSQDVQFTLTIASQRSPGVERTQMGDMRVRPRITRGLIAILSALSLAFCGFGTLSARQIIPFFTQPLTQAALVATNDFRTQEAATAAALATLNAASMTATAESDVDNDNLNFLEEQSNGTDPTNPDTDDDGLLDGQEVKQHGTNPLNRDSDGDLLLDGEEVELACFSPNNADTNGDGIDDFAESNNPNFVCGEIPTPTPTELPPELVGCPGSPPTRLEVGARGRVTDDNDIGNRLRSEPVVNEETFIRNLPAGTEFVIIGGPECDPDLLLRFWQVNASGSVGWTAEGDCSNSADEDKYYVEPLQAAEPQACQ